VVNGGGAESNAAALDSGRCWAVCFLQIPVCRQKKKLLSQSLCHRKGKKIKSQTAL
jgi:hypothetical protein